MEPLALAYITVGVAAPAIALVLAMLYVDRRWSIAIALVAIAILIVLFAYTAAYIFAVYSTPNMDKELIERGIAYQRVAAGQLAAITAILGFVAIGYYLELRRHG